MENQINQTFRPDEVSLIKHWDKARGEWITNVYPKISGRLRLAHEQNKSVSIETEIYKYDDSAGVAVVVATCKTIKGSFKGIGMSSVERDQKIAPAILELAETRAIARALRFSGFGVEYCSAEEVSHLENGNGAEPKNGNGSKPKTDKEQQQKNSVSVDGNNASAKSGDNGNGFKDSSKGSLPETKSGTVEFKFQSVDKSGNIYKPKFSVIENKEPDKDFKRNGGNGNGTKQMTQRQFEYIRSMGSSGDSAPNMRHGLNGGLRCANLPYGRGPEPKRKTMSGETGQGRFLLQPIARNLKSGDSLSNVR